MRFLLIAGLAESLVNFRGPLIGTLQAKGVEVHVAAPELAAASPTRAHLEARGVTVHRVPMLRTGTNPIADLHTLLALWRLMRRVCPDAVMGYTVKPAIYGSLAAWLSGVPRRFALITGLGYTFQGDGQRAWLQALVQCLYSWALSRVDLVFFQNPDDQALFLDRGILGRTTASFVVNGSGIDLSTFSEQPLPCGSARFLLIARLLGDKGVREYAEAARILRRANPEVTCALVGWLDSNPDAIRQSELDGWIADGSIEFLGRLDDVRPAIANCSVYVLPSYREGTPRTVLEAMAMGRPVITTDAPGCRETVVNGDNGYLVPVRSIDELVSAMQRFIDDPGLTSRMGGRARQIAEEKYDVHKVNASMLTRMGID